MVVGTKQLLELVKTQELVEGLDQRELINPEGAGFDLRVDKLLIPAEPSFLGITHRRTAEMKTIAVFRKNAKKQVIYPIRPGEFYLAKTIERVDTPENLLGIIKPRTTLIRCGVILWTGFVMPGYRGELFFGLFNTGRQTFKLEMGARFAHIVFLQISGNLVRGYEGQWQGGRASTKQDTRGLEKQI